MILSNVVIVTDKIMGRLAKPNRELLKPGDVGVKTLCFKVRPLDYLKQNYFSRLTLKKLSNESCNHKESRLAKSFQINFDGIVSLRLRHFPRRRRQAKAQDAGVQ